MMDDKKKRDIRLLLCLIAVAVLGLATLIIKRNFIFLSIYVPMMVMIIPSMYFNYAFCKWLNKWHGFWHEQNPGNGEPSDFSLITGKIGGWVVYIFMLVLALFPVG